MFELLMFFIINLLILNLNAFFKSLLFTKKKEADENAFPHEHLLNLEYTICI